MANGSIRGIIRDQTGSPIPVVSVQVNYTGAGAATIFSDRGGTPLSNPFISQNDASWIFYASTANRYDVIFTKATYTFDNTDTQDMGVDSEADGAVLTQHLANGAVTTAKLANLAVTDANLANDPTTDANRAVGTNHIKDLAITVGKIALASITGAQIAPGVIPTWYSTSGTTASISSHAEVDVIITHGLGSDDVVAVVYVKGNGAGTLPQNVASLWRRVDGKFAGNPDLTTLTSATSLLSGLPAAPTSGTVVIRLRNTGASAQTMTYGVYVRKN